MKVIRNSIGALAMFRKPVARHAVRFVLFLSVPGATIAQMGTPSPLPRKEQEKAAAEKVATGTLSNYPQLVDITASTGIRFEHLSSPEAKFIAESMSGGVALIDYDGDGWPDIYFTNAQNVEMALHGAEARSVLYHNNHDGTFTDATDKAGVGFPCWAMGASVGDYNNDGWPDGRVEAVVENLVGEPMILRPQGGPPNHWISFQLEGVKCNPARAQCAGTRDDRRSGANGRSAQRRKLPFTARPADTLRIRKPRSRRAR
jgi:FG-GAP-like repeat